MTTKPLHGIKKRSVAHCNCLVAFVSKGMHICNLQVVHVASMCFVTTLFSFFFQAGQVTVGQPVRGTPLGMMHSAVCSPTGWMTSWTAPPALETSFLLLWPPADQVRKHHLSPSPPTSPPLPNPPIPPSPPSSSPTPLSLLSPLSSLLPNIPFSPSSPIVPILPFH